MNAGDRSRQLLAGPRGRRLCAELVSDPGGGHRAPSSWARTPREAAVEAVRAALAHTDLAAVAQPERLEAALRETVDRAMYWQEPDELDVVLADDELAAHLAPVAEAVARAPASQWWNRPMAPGAQYAVAWLEEDRTGADRPGADRPRTSGAQVSLEGWREQALASEARAARERPADPRASWSGEWWSTPALADLVVTTRSSAQNPRSGAGIHVPVEVPVGLTLVEDEMGWSRARTWTLHPPANARVHEITGPEGWTALVAQHPLDVSASKRHDWWRVTGWDGVWLMPDWAAVATRFDAVHLTVDGYLSTAGRALPVDIPGAPARTLLGGWNPDATWWLADVFPEPGEPTDWQRRVDEPPRWEPTG